MDGAFPGRRNFVSAVESDSRCPTVTFYCRVVSWNSLRVDNRLAGSASSDTEVDQGAKVGN